MADFNESVVTSSGPRSNPIIDWSTGVSTTACKDINAFFKVNIMSNAGGIEILFLDVAEGSLTGKNLTTLVEFDVLPEIVEALQIEALLRDGAATQSFGRNRARNSVFRTLP